MARDARGPRDQDRPPAADLRRGPRPGLRRGRRPLSISVDTRRDWAVTWTDDDAMQRSSHALADDGRVWLIDPMDDAAALAAAEGLGEVTAVLQLLDRHPRDCESLARRYGVPHLRLPQHLPGSPFSFSRLVWVPGWREVMLWWPDRLALVVAESVGTAPMFAVGARAGIHPMLRVRPPAALAEHEAVDLLPGHGPALHGGAAAAVEEALTRSRRDLPRAAVAAARSFLPGPDWTRRPIRRGPLS